MAKKDAVPQAEPAPTQPDLVTELTSTKAPKGRASRNDRQFDALGMQYEHKKVRKIIWVVLLVITLIAVSAFFLFGTDEGKRLLGGSEAQSSGTSSVAASSDGSTTSISTEPQPPEVRDFTSSNEKEVTDALIADVNQVLNQLDAEGDYGDPDWELEFGIEKVPTSSSTSSAGK